MQNGRDGYVVFLWSPTGYSLREEAGQPPQIGDELEAGERRVRVVKIGASPFPGDPRPCVYTA